MLGTRYPSGFDSEDLGATRRLNHQYKPDDTTAHVTSRATEATVERGTNGPRIAAIKVTTMSPIMQAPTALQASFERRPICGHHLRPEVDDLHGRGMCRDLVGPLEHVHARKDAGS